MVDDRVLKLILVAYKAGEGRRWMLQAFLLIIIHEDGKRKRDNFVIPLLDVFVGSCLRTKVQEETTQVHRTCSLDTKKNILLKCKRSWCAVFDTETDVDG